jgi:hypothetical protein
MLFIWVNYNYLWTWKYIINVILVINSIYLYNLIFKVNEGQ